MAIDLDTNELESLRGHLRAMNGDYCGASEVIRAFLTGHGYGVSPDGAHRAAVAFACSGCSLDGITAALGEAALLN